MYNCKKDIYQIAYKKFLEVLDLHLAPPGSSTCDFGVSVPKEECEAAALYFWPNPGRKLHVGQGGTCCDSGWGVVPLGCSIQIVQGGGDGTAHYKISGVTCSGCIHQLAYQLVCKDNSKCFKYLIDIMTLNLITYE